MRDTKLKWADNLRVVATMSVIVLHVSAPLMPISGFTSSWWIANFSNSSVRFCVPVFVMLTGTLLLPKESLLKDFLSKRFYRIVLPFLFWSIAYVSFDFVLKIKHGEHLTIGSTIKFIFNQYRMGTYYHLWFVYMLIGLYLFIPILGKWVRKSTKMELVYFLIIWIYTLIFTYPFLSWLKINIETGYFGGFIGYMVLGYYLSIISFKNKAQKDIIAILLFIIGWVVSFLGTYELFRLKGSLDELFCNYLTINVMLSSIGAFLFFKDKDISNAKLIKVRDFINQHSYGIYLVHVLVLIMLFKIGITCQFITPIIGIPLTTILCLSISGGIIFLVRKIPFGKYIAG
ncbi:acyltransferase [Pedobacter duraquae]|uniref:Surface polysaccharide O-acyltransferase-like enzyme n=1 Tax=Pedobacter duraquae TaxID=425511 RepID=A0A4R6IJ22_9SPHI|nr:acyltransferase family protein [Pedobacter duraquae]TDO21981.1 surface polysaccharide O-acyltransferase-like enzyme [Pedobacter duraquae]